MVLTIRPTGSGQGDGFGEPHSAERMAARRAALSLFREAGYAATTVEQISRAAGISRRTFFRLFDGKHQIVSSDHRILRHELIDYLSRHESDRSFARAAKGAALVLDALTAVRADAVYREEILRSSESLLGEELLWFDRHRQVLAEFLSTEDGPISSTAAELNAALLTTAVRTSLRAWIQDTTTAPNDTFRATLRNTAHIAPDHRSDLGRIAIVETALGPEEIADRLRTEK